MTPQGNQFYKYAVEMINARSLAIDAINAGVENLSGILEIQASSIPGVTFLPGLLAGFRNEHDGVQYYVSVSDTQTVVDNISERIGEIGFVGEDVSSSAIECVKVASDRSVLISPLSSGIGAEVSLSEVAQHPFIWRETGSATRKSFEKAALEAGFEKDAFEVAALVDDMDAIVRSVEAGLGVAIISEQIASALGGRVNVSEIKDFNEARSFFMIRLKNMSLSPAAEAFAEYAKTAMTK